MKLELKELHQGAAELSAKVLFTGTTGKTTSISLKKDAILKEHITATDALLLCVQGVIEYNQVGQDPQLLYPGEYVNIPANIKHHLVAKEDSQGVLLK